MLYQLSYAPSVRVADCSRGRSGIIRGMSDRESEAAGDERSEDDLLAEQEGKGYGEDEGERDESLPPE